MEKYMNDITKSFDILIDEIKSSIEYQRYIELREKMNNDQEIMSIMDNIKKLQRKIVKLESEKKDYSSYEKQIESYMNILDTYPIYVEYNRVQNNLNLTFQFIKEKLEKTINNITN